MIVKILERDSRLLPSARATHGRPTARSAAIFAMGKPVAFEASAELRDTRGFISIMTWRPVAGFTPNCTFEPPVSTPISRMMATEASRISWYSLSVSVCAGATVIESPVCTPIGSRFSIEQTMMQLSAVSRTTSISNSFQPMSDSSTSTVWTGLSFNPQATFSSNSCGVKTVPAPLPPSVKLGRIKSG